VLNDDISLRKLGGGEARGGQQQPPHRGGKGGQETSWRAERKEVSLPGKQTSRKGEAGPESLIQATGGFNRTDLQSMTETKKQNEHRTGQESQQPQTLAARDVRVRGRGASNFGDERAAGTKEVRKSKSDFWDQTGRPDDHSMQGYRTHRHDPERRSEPKENGFNRRQVDGGVMSNTWSRGDRRRGDQSAWSRHSSPTRSSRGNSPNHRYIRLSTQCAFYSCLHFNRGLYFGPKTIFIPPLFLKMIFFPLLRHFVFDSPFDSAFLS
jgi:hypothetical protein